MVLEFKTVLSLEFLNDEKTHEKKNSYKEEKECNFKLVDLNILICFFQPRSHEIFMLR